jgi:hypothetical protein
MKSLIMLSLCVFVMVGCDQGSPIEPSGQPETPNTPAPPPPPPAQPVQLTCADVTAQIYEGPDPDKANARISAPTGQWAATTLFELVAYPTPLVDQRDVNSTGRWPVDPGTTAELQTDKPSSQPHQIDVRCNDQVIASKTEK